MPMDPFPSLRKAGPLFMRGDISPVFAANVESGIMLPRLYPATGLATGWDPNANGIVSALMESGGIIYAGGSFTGIGSATPELYCCPR